MAGGCPMASRSGNQTARSSGAERYAGPERDVAHGGPLLLMLNAIDEDPAQPRSADNPGFSEKNLRELAASILLRGVKTPISVRINPESPKRFLINHGARRFRASRMAGNSTIAAFIDNDYNEADQVVENLQRNELTPREIADYIGRELAKGFKKVDIAKSISKSAAFVSQHFALLDLPEPIAAAFNSGRVRDVTVINELVMVYKKEPVEVLHWLQDDFQQLTRGGVKLLRQFLELKRAERDGEVMPSEGGASDPELGEPPLDADDVTFDSSTEVGPPHPTHPGERGAENIRVKNVVVEVSHKGRPGRLLLQRRPGAAGAGWLRFNDDGSESEVKLVEVKLLNLLAG